MIDGMSEICIDCIHQEVCRYECHCPSEHCNDYAVADDFRPQGKWIYIQYDGNPKVGNWHCSECRQIAPVNIVGHSEKTRFCPYCGADMREEVNR